MARVPVRKVTQTDRDALKHLGDCLKSKVFGQDEAIESLATAIKMSRSGLGEEINLWLFLFSGLTGVGKPRLRNSWRVSGGGADSV